MSALWMLFLSLLVTIDAASLGPKPVDIPVAVVYEGALPNAREVPVNNDVGLKYAKVVKKPFAVPSGYIAALKNLEERSQLSPEEVVEAEQLNIPDYVAKFAIANDLENQPAQPVALDEPNPLNTLPDLVENLEQSEVSLDAQEQIDQENNVTPNNQNPETPKDDSSEESNESSSSEEEANENNNNVNVDENKEQIQENNENAEEMMIAQEDNSMKMVETPERKKEADNSEAENNLATEVKQEVQADPQVVEASSLQGAAQEQVKEEEVKVLQLRNNIAKNENSEASSTEAVSTTHAPTTQRPLRPFAVVQNVINRIGENALNILRPNTNTNTNNKPTVNREGEASSTTAAPNFIESFQNNVNTQMTNFANNIQGFFDRIRGNETQNDESSPPNRPLLDAIENQFTNGFNSFQNTVNNAFNYINPNAQANGTQSDEPAQPPNAVVSAIQNGLNQFQQTFTNAVQNLRPNQTQSDEGGGESSQNFPQQVMSIFQTSVQNFMSNFNPNRNNTQSDETTQSPNPISSFIGAISNVFAGNPGNQIQQAAQNITKPLETLANGTGVSNIQEQISQVQNSTGLQIPNPGNLEIPNPGNIEIPNPGNLQIPNPGNLQIPNPSNPSIPNPSDLIPGSSKANEDKPESDIQDESAQKVTTTEAQMTEDTKEEKLS